MTALLVAGYALTFVSLVLVVSWRAQRLVHGHAQRVVEWMNLVIVCEANGFDPEREYAFANFKAARRALDTTRVLARPWLLVTKGIL